jgi:hypothetical protein
MFRGMQQEGASLHEYRRDPRARRMYRSHLIALKAKFRNTCVEIWPPKKPRRKAA